MKKGLLVYRINRDDPANAGVINKCKAQRKAFDQSGFSVDMLWLCKDGVLKNEQLIVKTDIPPHSLKVYWFYFFRFGIILLTQVEKEDYDFIYLRHPFFDPMLVRSLRQIKKSFPKIKILLEINTYPYDAEPKRFLHRFSLRMDQYYRKGAYEYIDRIVDYGQHDAIWDIPTISVRNGIDLEKIEVSGSKPVEGKLRLIAVGNWSYWHGLDRLILAFENYYQKKQTIRILLKIVGEGSETNKLRELVKQKGLESYIEFIPSAHDEKLTVLFESADIGVGTLGLHRKGVELDSSLKHREYCARGIPFILSATDPDFPKELPFIHPVSKGEKEIRLEEVVHWFSDGMKFKTREYAKARLTWEKQLSAVFKWLKPD